MKDLSHHPRTRTFLQAFLGLSFLGWLDAFYLLWHRQKLMAGAADGPSFCSINSFIDCDAVALSTYSSMWGFPTAAWGMLFYSVLIVLSVWTYFSVMGSKDDKARAGINLLLISTVVTLPISIGKALVSIFVIKALCLMCLISYILHLALILLALKMRSLAPKDAAGPGLGASLRLFPKNLLIVVAVLTGFHALAPRVVEDFATDGQANALDDKMVTYVVNQHAQGTPKTIQTEGYPARGATADKAKVTIVEFSDMECPFCARANAVMHPLIKQYEHEVRVIFKNYPLDASCNVNIKGAGHRYACLAAKTGHCFFKQKGDAAFFAFKDEIFAKQKNISPQLIDGAAAKSGISATDLKACVADLATNQAILDQIAEGAAIGVEGTPAVFINGKFVTTGVQPKIIQALLEHYLHAKAMTPASQH